MVYSLAEGAEDESARGADAHVGVRLDHHSHTATHAWTINNICH